MAKILVVDDEPALVSTIGYNLRRDGHEVLTARTACAPSTWPGASART